MGTARSDPIMVRTLETRFIIGLSGLSQDLLRDTRLHGKTLSQLIAVLKQYAKEQSGGLKTYQVDLLFHARINNPPQPDEISPLVQKRSKSRPRPRSVIDLALVSHKSLHAETAVGTIPLVSVGTKL